MLKNEYEIFLICLKIIKVVVIGLNVNCVIVGGGGSVSFNLYYNIVLFDSIC